MRTITKEQSVRKERWRRFKFESSEWRRVIFLWEEGDVRYFLSRFSADDRMTVAPKGECSKSQRWQCRKRTVDFTLSSDTEFEAKFHLLPQYSSPALCRASLYPQGCVRAAQLKVQAGSMSLVVQHGQIENPIKSCFTLVKDTEWRKRSCCWMHKQISSIVKSCRTKAAINLLSAQTGAILC